MWGTIHSTKISRPRFLGGANGLQRVFLDSTLKRVLHSFKMADIGSLLLVLELDDKFNFINNVVGAASGIEI